MVGQLAKQNPRLLLAWLVHAFTASGAILGILAMHAIFQGNLKLALWYMMGAIFVDAADGTLARIVGVKALIPKMDGGLLDNIVDYINYVIVPAFFLMTAFVLPAYTAIAAASLIILVSSYQFCQTDAKTDDHFFKGFPSYWNIIIIYFFLWDTNIWFNLFVIIFFSILVFIPIKYVYPSRLDYLTNNKLNKIVFLGLTIVWGIATLGLLWEYPNSNPYLSGYTMLYMAFYYLLSFYRTLKPLE